MKALFKRFCNNKLVYRSAVLALCLFGFHLWQYIDSGFNVQPLVRAIFCFVYPFAVFFLGPKATPWYMLILGLTLRQFNDFTHYVEFFSIVVFTCYYDRFTVPAFFAYAIDTVIVCARHDKTAVHLGIHLLTCAIIYLAVYTVKELNKEKIEARLHVYTKPLDLTESEAMILGHLSDGKLQKEIKEYSENTVCKKLRECRIKNNCSTTEELLTRYIAQCDQSPQTIQH